MYTRLSVHKNESWRHIYPISTFSVKQDKFFLADINLGRICRLAPLRVRGTLFSRQQRMAGRQNAAERQIALGPGDRGGAIGQMIDDDAAAASQTHPAAEAAGPSFGPERY
jgi:hypothetical protein